jgi:hypothetical protein
MDTVETTPVETTTTDEATPVAIVDTDALLADISKTLKEWRRVAAALPDLLDLPGSLTERQKGHERERRLRLQQHLSALTGVAEQVTAAVATRAKALPVRDRMRTVEAAIEEQLDAAVDYRTIADRRERDREWERQEALRASLTAIDRGVEYFNARPALPAPLRALLTDTCAHCGHSELTWDGALPDLEAKVAEAERQIALAPGSLASLRQSVAPWLAEAATVAS